MKIETIHFNRKREEDKPFIVLAHSWWMQHRWIDLPDVLFSDYGFCTFIDGNPVFISFLYPFLGSETCGWGYQIMSPESTTEQREAGMENAATVVSEFAKNIGYKILMAYPGNKAILKRLQSQGFKSGDEIVIQTFKEL